MSEPVAIRVTLVRLKNPCNACIIVGRLLLESVERVKRDRPDIAFEQIELADVREAPRIPGIEVERFPSLLLNGEQISAGSMVTPRDLNEMMERLR